MNISEIERAKPYLPLVQQQAENQKTGLPQGGSFADTLKEFISDTNSLQKQSDVLDEKFIKGEPVDIHNVMIAAEKAKTSFQLLMEIRNKFIDMYKEVSKMIS